MREILKKEYALTASDIDTHRRLRMSALLSYLQNMATEHADILDFGGERMMREYGAVWIMVRSHTALRRPIGMDETLEIHTWPRGIGKAATVFRDFDIFAGGEHVGEVTMSWVLADLESRKILKPALIPAVMESPYPEIVKALVPGKIVMPAELLPAMTRPVYYSDTDVNGHMNNTRYADIVCDAIRYERCTGQFISELQINYLQESFPGDVLTILCGGSEDARYVRGMDDAGKSRFEARVVLADC